MATVAQLNAILRADTGQFVAGMNAAGGSLDKLAGQGTKADQKMREVGAGITRYVSLPLGVVGAAVIDTNLKFEQAFSNMKGLVGVSDAQLQQFRTSIEALGPAVGKGPVELGNALYYITSAGFEGAEAMQALEASAKASAAGLGSTEVIADTVTSALSAYADEGLTAAEATDILVATVREGKVEPDALAGSLGRVIPVAAALGVEFHEVGGAIAVMSKTGLNAAEATTALRGILTQLSAPTDKSKEALAAVGLTAEDLRSTLADKGLLALLQLMEEKFNGNAEALNAVFGDVRGLVGFLNIMGQDGQAVADVFNETAHSLGLTDTAMSAVSETAGFKMQKAMASLQTSMVKVGDTVLPMLATVADRASGLADGFSKLPGPAQQFAVTLGVVGIAAGPAVSLLGRLMPVLRGVGSAAAGVAGSFKGMNLGTFGMDAQRAGDAAAKTSARTQALGKAASGAAALVGAGIAVYGMWSAAMDAARASGEKLGDKVVGKLQARFQAGAMGIEEARAKMAELDGAVIDLSRDIADSSAPWDADWRAEMQAGSDTIAKQRDQFGAYASAAEKLAQQTGRSSDEMFRWLGSQANAGDLVKDNTLALNQWNKEQLVNAGTTDKHAAEIANMGDEYVDAELAIKNAQDELKAWDDAMKAAFDPVFAMTDSMAGLTEAQLAIKQAQLDYNEAVREHGPLSVEAQEAILGMRDAEMGLLEANVDLDSSARNLALAVQDGRLPMQEVVATIDQWAASGRITAAQAQIMKDRIVEAGLKAKEIDGTTASIWVGADISQAEAAFLRVQGLLAGIGNVALGKGSGFIGPVPQRPAQFGITGTWGMASGGVVGSPQVRLIGEAGPEAVIPLTNQRRAGEVMAEAGIGGNVYNINVSGGGDDRALAMRIADEIRRLERERGT